MEMGFGGFSGTSGGPVKSMEELGWGRPSKRLRRELCGRRVGMWPRRGPLGLRNRT